jgi:glutamate N-acetyltransferase/amino-acid N-acetyltransferase
MDAKVIKDGGVTSALGFQAAGIAAGIKAPGQKDMALIVSDVPAEVAATYTTDAKAMIGRVAEATQSKPREWLVCSTGRIGSRLPMLKVLKGIEKAVVKLGPENGIEAAKAIMTTDTRRKEFAMRFKVGRRKVTIGGMAKGAGMIHPNMATMLCFITTDANIDKASLRACVDEAVEHSFNRISIDGDTSTNDTVIVMANGQAGTNLIKSYHSQYNLFKKTLTHVMRKLARMIVEDGEGITRVVDVVVKGASSAQDAKLAALAIAKSELIKCSWAGGDPNWGRIMAALGYSGARVREEMVEIFYDGLVAVVNGQPSKTPIAKLRKLVRQPKFTITIHLHSGSGEYSILTTDLTEEYVRINLGE